MEGGGGEQSGGFLWRLGAFGAIPTHVLCPRDSMFWQFFFISARASSERSRDAAVHYYRRHLFKLHADKKALCKRVQFWLLCASPFHHQQVKFEVSSLASAENNCPLSSKPPLLQLVSSVKSAANWDSCSP